MVDDVLGCPGAAGGGDADVRPTLAYGVHDPLGGVEGFDGIADRGE
ncbi:hypothetical protein ACGGAQ_15210 [Micromonospora sp. NPDC047557]